MMPKISSAEDLYRTLVEDSDESWVYGLLSFAIVEEIRIDWMKHFEEHIGRTPNTDEIKHWYEQQPQGVLLSAKGDAEHALQAYADEVLEEVLEVERRDVAEGVIVSEIRLARSFLPQFGINVAGGLVSTIVFAAILGLVAFLVWTYPSPVDVGTPSPVDFGKQLSAQQTEEGVDGKTRAKPKDNE